MSLLSTLPRRHFRLTATMLGLIVPLAAARAQKPAEPGDEIYKAPRVCELVIELGAKELDSLRREPRTYVRATLKEGDKVYKDVGVHLKGAAGSFRGIDDKPSLTVNMDKFAEGQRFHGMDKFHLNNSLQDPSYLSEMLCGELFRAAGVPAARVGHAVVTINGKRRGLYYIREGYDDFFLKRHFAGDSGNFYDGGFLRDVDQPLHLVGGKDDVKDRADLKALVAAARERDPKERFRKLEKVLDLDRFVSFLVVEVIAWDWDGYPMKCNNYRIYHDPKSDKLTFIPSGMDQMFADVHGPILPDFQGMVARGLLSTPEGRQRYVDRMEEVLKKVYDPEKLVKRLDEYEKVVRPVLASIDAGAGRDHPNQVNRLKQALRERAKNLNEQVKRLKK